MLGSLVWEFASKKLLVNKFSFVATCTRGYVERHLTVV